MIRLDACNHRLPWSFKRANVLAPLPGAKLPQRAEPVFHVVGFGDVAVFDGLDIDCHHRVLALRGALRSKED